MKTTLKQIRILMSRQDMTKPTLENLLVDIISDLQTKSEMLIEDHKNIEDLHFSVTTIANTVANNAKIIDLLRQAIEIQENTMSGHDEQ